MTCEDDAAKRKEIFSQRGKRLLDELALPFEEKVSLSLAVVRKALDGAERPVISSSFGKDSIALTFLVHMVAPSVPVVMVKTGQQYPETLKYADLMKERYGWTVHEVKPNLTFKQVVEKYGYPKESRNSKTGDKGAPACCELLKKKPMQEFVSSYGVDLNFVGLLGDEGRQRRMVYIMKGSAHYKFEKGNYWKCIPLIWWTGEDVWKFHELYEIPRNPVYEKYQIERTGCVFCTGHRGWSPQLARTHPKVHAKIMKDQGTPTLESFGVST